MVANHDGKRRRLAMNSMFSVIAWLFPILLGFISTPILVRNLGNEQYGVFAIVLGFISYSFTFGVGKVAGKYVPEYQSTDQPERVTQVISATFWFSLTIGILGSLILVLLAPYIVSDLLLISASNQPTAIYSFYFAGGIGLVLMLSQVFQFVLQGLHRFDNYLALTNLNGLLLGAGNIVLAINGYGVAALLAWNLTVVSFTGVLFYLRAKHLLPSIRLVRNIPREMMTRVVRYAGSIILYQIFANVLFIFERAWVMRRFGAEALTFYFVPMLLTIYMHGFISSIVQAVFPVVNELLDARERVAVLYMRANKIILAIVVFGVTNFIVCGALFLKLWVSPELAAASYNLLVPHALTFGLISLAIMSFQLAEAFKLPVVNVIMTGSWMLIAIPLMIVGSDLWQTEGVAWARFAAALVTIPVIAYGEWKFLGEIEWRFWTAAALRVGSAAAAMALVETLILSTGADSYLSLFLAGSAGAVVYAAVLILTGLLTPNDRETIMGSLSRRRSIETSES